MRELGTNGGIMIVLYFALEHVGLVSSVET
jgi:hypothetical protein